ncbi:ETS homologous factor-like isoform X2 [Penaeus japonicus]|nr:ETS homologous factor-like isoform X2 [Penaeus japonicus]
MTGAVLMNFSVYDFCNLDNVHGSLFYKEFQRLCNTRSRDIVDNAFPWPPEDTQACVPGEPLLFPEDNQWSSVLPADANDDLDELLQLIDSSTPFFDSNFQEGDQISFYESVEGEGTCSAIKAEDSFSSVFSDDIPLSPSPEPPCDALGKISTKSRKKERGPKNWEFMLRLLMDERYNPELIRWENEAEKTFRLVKPNTIAQMWGKRANKRNLSYDNFARGLRYQYTTGALEPVPERQLVYKCGPKALQFWKEMQRANSRRSEGFHSTTHAGKKNNVYS